jgi:hypothetical protein
MNRLLFVSIVLPLFMLCSHHGPIHAAVLSNRYLLVDVDDDSGRLFVSTREGIDAPGDERRHLLFYDEPPSSYTLIFVDDDLFMFGGDRGVFLKRPVAIGNYIETRWGNDIVHVTLIVQWVQREGTAAQDGILIRYEVENRTDRDVELGLRVLFDTHLAEQTGPHFNLADGTELEYETELTGRTLPRWWESSDNSDVNGEADEGLRINPALRGTLYGRLIDPPQKVLFANYRSLLETPLQFAVEEEHRFHNLPYSINDSAVALFFGPEQVRPGGVTAFGTILGLRGEGEYVLGSEKAILSEKMVRPVEPSQPKVDADELENLLREMERVRVIRGSVERIDALIEELNGALESEEKSVSEERLAEIRELLRVLTEEVSLQPAGEI